MLPCNAIYAASDLVSSLVLCFVGPDLAELVERCERREGAVFEEPVVQVAHCGEVGVEVGPRRLSHLRVRAVKGLQPGHLG